VRSETEPFEAQLRDISRRIDPGLLAELRTAHVEYGFNCSAMSEGLVCCLDWLTDPDEPS